MSRKIVHLKVPSAELAAGTTFNPHHQGHQREKLTVAVMSRRVVRLKVPPAKLAVTKKSPRRGLYELNTAVRGSSILPVDTIWLVVGWSNGFGESSARKKSDHVLVAKVHNPIVSYHQLAKTDSSIHRQVTFRSHSVKDTDSSISGDEFTFSKKWLMGSGWEIHRAIFGSKSAWPRRYSPSKGPQPSVHLGTLYEVPLKILKRSFTADCFRCECGLKNFRKVEKHLAKTEHTIWSAQRGYTKA